MRLFPLALVLLAVASPTAAQYEASLVTDLRPGPEGAITRSIHDVDYFSPTVYDGRLFFAADDGQTGQELWAYDAATDETVLAADVNPGPAGSGLRDLAVYDGRLFFAADDGETGRELWVYDAATGEATLAADVNPDGSSFPQYLTVYDDRLFFNAYGPVYGPQLYVYDAQTGEATMAGDSVITGEFYPFHLTVYDERLFFSADDFENDIGRELWVYDAVTDAITLAADIAPGIASSLSDDLAEYPLVYDDRLFVLAELFDNNLWAFDAGTAEASLVAEVPAYHLTVYDERLFFSGNGALGAYDARTGEVSTVADVYAWFLTVYDGRLFFAGLDSETGHEPWLYDAATGETTLAADINPDGHSSPQGFIVYDGRLFFSADDGTHGRELWALSPAPVAGEPGAITRPARLHAPHPNPARSEAAVTFEAAEAGPVRVEVFDVLGRRVAVLTDEVVTAGTHTTRWEAGTLPSGLYLIRLQAGDQVQTQRLTLTR